MKVLSYIAPRASALGAFLFQETIIADITMCADNTCPSFEKCYRAQAPVNEWRQSYFLFSPRLTDGTCPEYSPISPGPYDDE